MTLKERADILSMRLLQRDGIDRDKIEQAFIKIRNEALEEAAKQCERWAEHYDDAGSGHLMCVAIDCGADIRALALAAATREDG